MIVSTTFILIGLVVTVLLRYVFNTDLFGIEELIIIPSMWMYFVGASYGTYKQTHISADLINSYVRSERIKQAIQLFNSIICFAIAIVFTIWANDFVSRNIQTGATSSGWNYPLYIPQSALLIGFALMCFYLLVLIIQQIKRLISLT